MKKVILCVLMTLSSVAGAENSVIINGQTFTCSNSCVVTFTPPNKFVIKDCCGGTIKMILK